MKTAMNYVPVKEKFVTSASLKTEKPPVEYSTITINGKEYPYINSTYHSFAVTMEAFKKFAVNADRLIEMFGEEIIEKHLNVLSMSDLTTEEFYPEDTAMFYCDKMGACITGKRKHGKIKEYKGGWEREKEVLGYDVVTRNGRFNTLYEGKLIKYLLIEKWPWLNDFNLSVYGLHGGTSYEFYAEFGSFKGVENNKPVRSLYVPFEALVKQDSNIIRNRMETYFGDYYRGKPDSYATAMSVFDKFACQVFLEYVDGGAPEHEKVAPPPEEIKVYGKKYGYVLIFVDKGILQIPSTYPNFNSAYEILCNWINSLYVGRENEILSVQPYFNKGSIKVNLGTAYEAMIVRVEI